MVSSSISSKGDIAFLYKEYPNSKKKEAVKNDGEMVAAYRLRLFEIGASAKKLEASTLRLTEGFAQTMDIFYDKSDALNICGFSSKTLKDDSDRIFAGKVGRDGNLSSVIQNKLSKTDIERINVARRKKSDKDADNGIDSDYLIKQVKLFEDGSYEVYLEEDYWFTTQVYNGKSYTTYYYYVTNMILRLRFTAVGNLEKMHILPKVATYGTPIYESYTAMENPRDDKDYFVYNMERTDMDDDVNKVPDRRGTGILNPEIVITSMSPSGELKREVLFYKEEKGKRLLLPSESESLGDGKYFLVIGEGKGLRLAFVSFK